MNKIITITAIIGKHGTGKTTYAQDLMRQSDEKRQYYLTQSSFQKMTREDLNKDEDYALVIDELNKIGLEDIVEKIRSNHISGKCFLILVSNSLSGEDFIEAFRRAEIPYSLIINLDYYDWRNHQS